MSSRRPAAGGAGGQEKHKETYDEWLARVERKKKTKKFMEKRGEKEEATRKEHSKGESGAAYQLWLRKKAIAEKATQLLRKLDATRADEDETWRATAVSLHAVEALLKSQGGGIKSGLRKAWVEWTKKHHRFGEIKISRDEAFDRLTGGARSMLQKVEDGFVIYGLVYTYPPMPKKPGDIVKPLTSDDKFKNEVFERSVAAVWRETKKEMAAKIEENVKERLEKRRRAEAERAGKPADGGEGGADEVKEGEGDDAKEPDSDAPAASSAEDGKADDTAGDEAKAAEGEQKAEDGDGGPKDKPGADSGDTAAAEPVASVLDDLPEEEAAALRGRALQTLGLRQLSQWVEQDIDAQERRARADVEERDALARKAHDGWSSKKDAMRIRLPPQKDDRARKKPGAKWQPPRFNFAKPGAPKVVRSKKTKFASTTLDFAKHSGLNLKYAHASGGEADLQASRKKLLKGGHVYKENFADPEDGTIDSDGEDQFRRELAGNPKRRARRSEGKQAEKARKEKYEAWQGLKVLRDRALEMLPAIALPASGDQQRITWMRVGRALKAVDRTLLNAWTEWSSKVEAFTAGECSVAWDSFAPVCCDTHAPSSAVRDTFLKLLHRKGVDWKSGFEAAKEKKRTKAEIRGEDFDEGSDGLTPKEFRHMLEDLGVSVSKTDLRRLVRLFDLNGDGIISGTEFLSFVGKKRRTLGDLDEALANRCLWENRCHQCGMAAAFDYIIDTEATESEHGAAAGAGERRSSRAVAGVVAQLKYKRVSLPDHEKKARQKYHRGDDDAPPGSCEESKWGNDKREGGLKVLADLSRERRKQAAEEAMWKVGNPPSNPRLDRVPIAVVRAKKEDGEAKSGGAGGAAATEDSKAIDDDATDANSLHLVWSQPADSDPVNFYVLESSGAEGSASQRAGEWHRIFTDPPTAYSGMLPRGSFTITGLQPATTFHFRIRAYNLHGASAYAIRVFTTAPLTPPAPIVVGSTAKSLKLRWTASEDLRRRVRKMRQLFDKCDKDGSGTINRSEMMFALKRDRDLRKFLQAATDGDGINAFDAMERNDDEELNWEEFYSYLVSHGVLEDKKVARMLRSSAESVGDDGARGGGSASSGDDGPTSSRKDKRGSTRATDEAPPSASDFSIQSSRGRPVEPIRYSLMQCLGEDDGVQEWEEIYVGLNEEREITSLAPGRLYNFRVQAINGEGFQSAIGPPVVAVTTLQQPPPPTVASTRGITPTTIRVKWPAFDPELASSSATVEDAKGGDVEEALVGWAAGGGTGAPPSAKAVQAGLDAAGKGVNVQRAFARYDKDGSGMIERDELDLVLQDLGVTVTQPRLDAAFAELDADDSGSVSFDEFARWFASQEVTYVLKRDEGTPLGNGLDTMIEDDVVMSGGAGGSASVRPSSARPRASRASASGTLTARSAFDDDARPMTSGSRRGRSGGMSVIVYRGKALSAEADGLKPNYRYRFALRHISSRSSSPLSTLLVVYTPPLPPFPPVCVNAEPRRAQLRWYPGSGGAHKYILEKTLVEALPGATRPVGAWERRSTASLAEGKEDSWSVVYEGRDPFADISELTPNAVYRFRVRAVNQASMVSAPSGLGQVVTPELHAHEKLSSRNAETFFTIDCAGDIVIGDTILFTEEVFIEVSGEPRFSARFSTTPDVPREVSAAAGGAFLCTRTIAAIVFAEREIAGPAAKSGSATSRSGSRSVVALSLDGMSVASSTAGGRRKSRRQVGMKVVWCTVSSKLGEPYKFSKGQQVWRKWRDLTQWDISRVAWVDEAGRWSADDEKRAGVR